MKTIIDYLKSFPCDKNIFINEIQSFTYEDILNLYKINKKTIDKISNYSVVINTPNRLEFAKLLSILDGNVKRIVFLPPDIDSSLLNNYYEDSKASFIAYLENDIVKTTPISKEIALENISQTQWLIPTSGTTNNPKLITHTFKSLTKSTKKSNGICSNYIWGLTFDIYRFSGLQVFLQAILGGSSIIIPSTPNFIEMIKIFIKNHCNIISATPSFWRKVLMIKESKELNLKRITLGGEICDEQILTSLRTTFPDCKITHIYASTEVGVGFSVTDEKSGFPFDYVKNGFNNSLIKVDENSILWIKPNNSQEFINTGDIVKIENDRVYFLGRETGSINVGGNKVQPEEIESKLLTLNFIKEVYVYAKKNPILGSLVCADIVIKDSDKTIEFIKEEIFSFCRKNLENFKIPAILNIVETLELTSNGKKKRS